MIKNLIAKKTEEKRQRCNRLKWEIALLQAKIEHAKREKDCK